CAPPRGRRLQRSTQRGLRGFPRSPHAVRLAVMLPLLRARRRRIREAVRTRRDRHDVAVVVDGLDAVLQTLLEETVCVPGRRGFVICGTCARRWFAPPIWRRAHTTARWNSGEAFV